MTCFLARRARRYSLEDEEVRHLWRKCSTSSLNDVTQSGRLYLSAKYFTNGFEISTFHFVISRLQNIMFRLHVCGTLLSKLRKVQWATKSILDLLGSVLNETGHTVRDKKSTWVWKAKRASFLLDNQNVMTGRSRRHPSLVKREMIFLWLEHRQCICMLRQWWFGD